MAWFWKSLFETCRGSAPTFFAAIILFPLARFALGPPIDIRLLLLLFMPVDMRFIKGWPKLPLLLRDDEAPNDGWRPVWDPPPAEDDEAEGAMEGLRLGPPNDDVTRGWLWKSIVVRLLLLLKLSPMAMEGRDALLFEEEDDDAEYEG